MDFDLTDDQEALRDGARELLDGLAPIAGVRRVVEAGGGIDEALWSGMVDQGWLGVALAEDDGGLGLGWVELAVLLEAIGRHAAPAPFCGQVLAIDALDRAGHSDAVKALLAGTHLACVAWSKEPRAVTAVGTDGSGWRLEGRADPTPFAPSADLAIVVAESPDGPALFSVELDDATRPSAEPAMDRTRELGWLRFDGTVAERLGGSDAVAALLDRGATGVAAEMLGGADRVLEMAVEYAKDRVQFGKPIGSFQAVKHRCADMLVDVEGMRSSVYWAAWCLAAGDRDASVAASTA
jgi:alkylation response protein AidB-like acyl-CoA dehydrogenase